MTRYSVKEMQGHIKHLKEHKNMTKIENYSAHSSQI